MEQIQGASIPVSYARAREQADLYECLAEKYKAMYGTISAAWGPVASSAPYTSPIEDMDPEAVRQLKLRAALRIGSGEELISVAVRTGDGSIDTRPA